MIRIRTAQSGQYGDPASEAPTTRFIASGNPVNGAAGFNSCSAGQLSGTASGNGSPPRNACA